MTLGYRKHFKNYVNKYLEKLRELKHKCILVDEM